MSDEEEIQIRGAIDMVLNGFEKGIFIREIKQDNDPKWLMKLSPYILALAELSAFIEKVPDET